MSEPARKRRRKPERRIGSTLGQASLTEPPAERQRVVSWRAAGLLGILSIITALAIYQLRLPAELASDSTRSQRPVPAETQPQKTARSSKAWEKLIEVHFAGDQSCAECHAQIYQAHLRSGHSHTLTPMHESPLAKQLIAARQYDDLERDQTLLFFNDDDQFWVRDADQPALPALPVTWLLGSGKHAQTPVAVDEATQSGVELRWSFLANEQALGVTPDQERFQHYHHQTRESYGRPMDADDIRACLGCHTTVGPPSQVPIQRDLYIPNVGCERCHGPRKKHVQLARQGRAEAAPPLLKYQTAEAYMAVCSQCHRDENSVSPTAQPHELVRFQPYGLKRSRCYQADPQRMTCSACHDPHDAVSRDRATYIANCQQCHAPQSDAQCKSQPVGDCITCHMPSVEWTAGIAFHDHWIRIPE